MDMVRISLSGSPEDLEMLSLCFPGTEQEIDMDPRVWPIEAGTFYLASRRLDEAAPDADSSVEIYEHARDLLHWVVGAVRCVGIDCSSVRLIRWLDFVNSRGGFYQVKVEPDLGTFTRMPPNMGSRLPSYGEPDPRATRRLIDLAWNDPDVAEVLYFLAYPVLDWINLYKIFEIVRSNIGGDAGALVDRGWVGQAEIRAFKSSANRPDISGRSARHARAQVHNTAAGMTIAEATPLVTGLVRSWTDAMR